MKEIAHHIFDHALRESSISHAFTRHVHCDRSVLRICDDLYDLNSYSRRFVISIGKAAHSMLTALHEQTGERFEGIVASSVEPEFHVRGFRYFHGGHPLPIEESIREPQMAAAQSHPPSRPAQHDSLSESAREPERKQRAGQVGEAGDKDDENEIQLAL